MDEPEHTAFAPRRRRSPTSPAPGAGRSRSAPGSRIRSLPPAADRGDRLRQLLARGEGDRRPARGRRRSGETDAFAASEAPLGRPYDRVVAISRSGTTTEVRQALAAAPAGRVPRRPRSSATPTARSPPPPRRSSTSPSPTTARSSRAASSPPSSCLARAWLGEDVAALPAAAAAALDAPLAARPGGARPRRLPRPRLAGRPRRRRRAGAARDRPVLGRVLPGDGVPPRPDRDRRRRAPRSGSSTRRPRGWPPRSPRPAPRRSSAARDPLAELVRVQRLAVAIAERRGLDPDRPPNLTRAVVLDLEPEEAR